MTVLSDGPPLNTFGVSLLCSARIRRCINLRSRNHRTLVTPERGNAGHMASAARGGGRATALRGLRVILGWLFVAMVGLGIMPPVLSSHVERALGAWRWWAPQCAGRDSRCGGGGRAASSRELRSSSGRPRARCPFPASPCRQPRPLHVGALFVDEFAYVDAAVCCVASLRAWSGRRGDREEGTTRQQLTRRLGPLRDERRLELDDRRPGEARVRLAPLARTPATAQPLVIEAEAAGVADCAVDHDPADVRAMVRPIERITRCWAHRTPSDRRPVRRALMGGGPAGWSISGRLQPRTPVPGAMMPPPRFAGRRRARARRCRAAPCQRRFR